MNRNLGLVWLNGLFVLHDISTFEHYRSQIMVVVERECSLPTEKHEILITNRPQGTQTLAQYTQNDENLRFIGKTYLLNLTNDIF